LPPVSLHAAGLLQHGESSVVAAAILRNEGYEASGIVFGCPSCFYPATFAEELLNRHVVSVILDADVIPRLNNNTVFALIPAEGMENLLLSTKDLLWVFAGLGLRWLTS